MTSVTAENIAGAAYVAVHSHLRCSFGHVKTIFDKYYLSERKTEAEQKLKKYRDINEEEILTDTAEFILQRKHSEESPEHENVDKSGI